MSSEQGQGKNKQMFVVNKVKRYEGGFERYGVQSLEKENKSNKASFFPT